MDMRSWKKVLLQWINECSFMQRNYLNIEQTDIELFYKHLCSKHKSTAAKNSKHISEFFKEYYPGFEINFGDDKFLSSADYIYVYSLLLHFCCVKKPETFFHEICQRLPDFDQQCIAVFFKELLDTDPITKEAVRHAIAAVGNLQMTPPRPNDSFSSNATSISIGGLSSASFPRCDSPLKTPKRCAGPQRISPSTPKTNLLEERTRELYNLRAELETERYEKGLLEAQIKQSEDEIQKLNNDHKRLLQHIQDIKNEIFAETNDGSTKRDGEESQVQKRILKEISQKEQEIFKLSNNVRNLRDEKSLVEKNLFNAEKQIVLCMNRIKELDMKVEELTDEIKEKNDHIKYLSDNKLELERFISETRSAGANGGLNTSGDCLDTSFLRNNSNGSNSVSSPENLGASVVDVQLREKEHENQQLKEELKYIRFEHRRLAKHLTKLTQEFDLPIDAISTASSEGSGPDTEKQFSEDSSFDEPLSCEEHFYIFNKCVEEIDKFHKTEKSKVFELQQLTSSLEKKNQTMTQQLSELTVKVHDLQDKLLITEKLQQETEKSRQELASLLQKSQSKILDVEKKKNIIYNDVQSLQMEKDNLNKNILQLKTELELKQQECRDLLAKNKNYKDNEQNLLTRLQELDKVFSNKTAKWEEEVKHLNEKLTKQFADIDLYKQAEKTIKSNYEQLVVQNEELKKEARQANIHLTEMRKDLKEKEKQLSLLGKEIASFKQNNELLEKNINSLMEEHKKELATSSFARTELDEQLSKLKERLNKTELLLDSKQHECQLKEDRLKELKSEITKVLQYFTSSDKDNDNKEVINIIKTIKTHVQNALGNKENLTKKVDNLQCTLKEISVKSEKLACELKEKNQDLQESKKSLLSLQAENFASENKIAELQQQQLIILKKVKSDLQKKEQELHDRLKEASLEYEASLERIAVELKSEKEHHTDKEMELILTKAELNETKRKLNEFEIEIEKLCNDKEQLESKCERLKQFETRMVECSGENDKLRYEIETFKQQVTQNALRLLEADKALAEFIELTKEQHSAKDEVDVLLNKLKEKDKILLEIEFKLQQQSIYEEQIEHMKQQLNQLNDLTYSLQEQIRKLDKDKEHLSKDIEEKHQQILKEHKDKTILLNSLEESTDKLKLMAEEKQQQKAYLEKEIKNLMEQRDVLSCQNTKLQGDLVEREAEFRLALDELQQEKDDFQQKLTSQTGKLAEKSKQLESTDLALIEIIAMMENNFNLSRDFDQNNVKNVFNYEENKGADHIQELREHLNNIFFKQQNLSEKLEELTSQKESATISLATLKDTHSDLAAKFDQQEKTLKEMEKQLQNEELILGKRALQEVKRLEEDLLNLEKVNECLGNENLKMQVSLSDAKQELKDSRLKIRSLENETAILKDEVSGKSSLIEKIQHEDKKLQNTLKEKCQQFEKMSEKCKYCEYQLKEKTTKMQNLEREHQETKEKAHKSQQRILHCQQTLQNQQAECKKLQEKLKLLQTSNDSLEAELANRNKESLTVKNKNSDLLQQCKNQEQQFQLTSQKLDEMIAKKLDFETKCEQLQSEIHQLKRDLDLTKVQHQAQQEDNNRFNQEIESLKVDKQHLRDEVCENKLTLQRANENVTQLIQQISSIRLEKEAAIEENVLLRKQIEETGKSQTTSETKMKSIVEKSQDLERKLLAAENEIKSLKANLEKSESSTEKLQIENQKLRDNQEVSTKRIEKLALKLGDCQARNAKLERDNEKLGRTLEAHAASVEALQREKDMLQSEAKCLKERLSRAERGHEQLVTKVQNLEHLNTNLQQTKQKLEASEIDGKTKINKLEKMREINEEKLRKLTNSLNNAESANVKLNLEIGALNSQLQKIKVEHDHEQTQEIDELNQKLCEAQALQHKYEEINEKFKIELSTIKEENSSLNDQLSKASLSLQITSQKCERFAAEIEQIRAEMLIMRQEKTQIEQQHETSMKKINQFESQNIKIIYENKNLVKKLEQKIITLEEELAAKTQKIADLEKEIELLKENEQRQNSLLSQQNMAANITELEDLRTKISLAEDLRLKDQQTISQLRLDNQILHTKYQESKQGIRDATNSSDERIKENRLELEGKLEKMKSKMKTLYTEEIAKMKTKQDREMAILKSEMEVLKNQNAKYEEHTRKLSNQIVRLNDNILQYQKENTIISTKLKLLTDQLQEVEHNKRPASIHVSSTSLSTAPANGPNIGPNLAMEDEEGEVFNNTYLTDLKNGHLTELMSRDVCVEELKYRNSLLPPHLRSTYAAQFDHEFGEEDLKDGPHSFDDSMSALLSTTAGGTRKKCTGVTHYKRPGPPTPSKNGGRLSFGGSTEPAREILKEAYDSNAGSAVSSTKTPARFNFFTSRFSMGTTRDEKSRSKKDTNGANSAKVTHNTRNMKVRRRILPVVGCASTPRKSQVHFDQRRLLDQIMKSSPSPSPLSIENNLITKETKTAPPDISLIETPLTALDRHDASKDPMHKTIAKRWEAIAGGLQRCRRNSSLFGRRLSRRIQEICTPTSGETTSSALSSPTDSKNKTKRHVVVASSCVTSSGGASKTILLQRRLRKKPIKERSTRPSLCLRGNIFAKYRKPNKGPAHDLNRHKSRKQRTEHFNKCRNIKSFTANGSSDEKDKTISCSTVRDITYDLRNNKFTTFSQHKLLGETVVLGECLPKKREVEEETFTFGEEQFEHPSEFPDTEDNDMEEENNNKVCDGLSSSEKYDKNFKPENYKPELVTSKDLEDFDCFIANYKLNTNNKKSEECSSQGSSEHFEKLLLNTESNAPFEINHIQFNTMQTSNSNSQRSSFSNNSQQTDSQYDENHSVTTATPHLSPINRTCHLSRTIYGGTVIYNHRLPNINTTYVRKSSIYVKNRRRTSQHNLESSSCNDVVLITDQTITFVDLMRMWSQMDSSTRIIVSFAILASITTLFGIFLSLCSRR